MSKQTELAQVADTITVNSGNVGIGTSSPNVQLKLEHANSPSVALKDLSTNDELYLTVENDIAEFNAYTAGTGARVPIVFTQYTDERMRLDASGNVGIGTSSPSSYASTTLEISGSSTSSDLKMTNTTTGTGNTAGFDLELNGSDINYVNRTASGVQKFWTNATERMRIDSAGRVTKPYQPAFSAYLILNPNLNGYSSSGTFSASSTGIGSTAGTPLVLKHTKINRGNHYSTSTGRFTAPVAGAYQFHFSALPDWSQAAIHVHAEFYINGASTDAHEIYGPNSATQHHISQVSGSTIFELSAGDYVSMQFQGGFHQRYTIFCGHLIG